jgi:hypothetical protein
MAYGGLFETRATRIGSSLPLRRFGPRPKEVLVGRPLLEELLVQCVSLA